MNLARHTDISEEPRPAELTLDDFRVLHEAEAFENRRKVELIEGVLFEVAPQQVRHARFKSRLAVALAQALQEAACPLEVLIEPTVAMLPKSAPEPDIAIVSDQEGDDYVALSTVALLIEISSTTFRFDSGEKAALYARNNVPEYWIFDLQRGRAVILTEPRPDGFRARNEFEIGGRLSSITIDGLSVDTANLI